MKRNAKRLRQIADVITAYPEAWDQGLFSSADGYKWYDDNEKPTLIDETIVFDDGTERNVVCGTTQCVAGWAVALKSKRLFRKALDDEVSWVDEACKILGLTEGEGRWLFLDCMTDDPDEMASVLDDFADGLPLFKVESNYYAR